MRTLTQNEMTIVHGGTGPGYGGAPTPEGYTDYDGTGRFMVDGDGALHMNPAYAEYMERANEEINWWGVARDLGLIGIGSGLGAGGVTSIGRGLLAAIGSGLEAWRDTDAATTGSMGEIDLSHTPD